MTIVGYVVATMKDPNSCGEGEEFCKGAGTYEDRELCCPIGTCFVMPNGYPQCKLKI